MKTYIVKWHEIGTDDSTLQLVVSTNDKKKAFEHAIRRCPYRIEAVVYEDGTEIYRGTRA